MAFAIFAAGSAVVLGQLRGIISYVGRFQTQQTYVTEAMNQSALFSVRDTSTDFVQQIRGDVIDLSDPDREIDDVEVTNFAYEDVDVPVSIAYSPYQIYSFGPPESRHKVHLLLPGLLPDL